MDTMTKMKLKTRALLDGFIKNHPIASKKLAKAKPLYFQSHMLGFWGVVGKHIGNGFMVIGDAGGFVSYPTGEGIYYSMKAGQFAAETFLEASGKGDFSESALRSFDTKVSTSIVGSDMSKGLALRKMFLDDDAKQEMSVGMMLKDTKFADTIGKLVAGHIPYKTLIP
jgi:flavin-dependent dehydrogenase